MVQGPKPENADPLSMLWCREDNLFKRNYQFAEELAAKNKRDFRLNFNPGPSAPRQDGTREANPNVIDPFNNLDGLLSHVAAQRATVDHSAEDADSEDAPAPPKQKKKSKASKPSATPKASTVKPLKTAPPEASVKSEDLSWVSKRTKKTKKPMKISGHDLTPATVLRNEEVTIDLSSDEDLEKEHFKKNMAKLSVADEQILKKMLHDLKEQFHKKHEEAKGSRERMKYFAQKCVQAHNEAEKRKALGRPGIDPRMAVKQKKKSVVAQTEAPRQEEPHIVFPAILPQLDPQSVSSPAPTSSELISIGRPLTPIAQDDSWAERPQQDTPVHDETPRTPPPQVTTPVLDDNNYMVQTSPSPKASPAFRRLRKGPRPQVTMSSIPEGEVHQSSVACQVFPEATPTANVSESEAKAAEDIPAALANQDKEEREEERVATPPATDQVILEENVIVPDPPVLEEMEVKNTKAATNNATEANDTAMAKDNVEREANENAEVTVTPIVSEYVVPPLRPHTMERAFNREGQLVTVRWAIMVPPTAPGPQYDYHVEQRPQVQKPKPRLPRLLGASTTQGSFSVHSFREHNTFFDSAKNPYTKP
nr:fibrous sheath CABYR-binding protein-like [Aegilops tauschii subsp. strangulata]